MYNCAKGTYCVVPEAKPEYIIEPVACAVNMEMVCHGELKQRDGGKMLIIGTGFLAKVFHQTVLQSSDYSYDISVLGKSNADYWGNALVNIGQDGYDVVVDLKGSNIIKDVKVNPNAMLILASAPHREYNFPFEDWLWNNVTIKMPSPRAETFHNAMKSATKMVSQGKINLDNVWTNSYNRETNWKQGFSDALDRPENYSRGYIKWN
jgi:threonine dehydrogenase-like Zn-dependent dehydrogenase